MSKDPAINWYFDNWDGGTKLMTRHQKGCYMDLLSAQFHCGHLTLEDVKKILGSDFAEWDKSLKAKFVTDQDGRFFNERTEHEIQKRLNEKNGKSNGGKNAMKKRWGDKNLNKILNKNLNKILNKSLGTEIETEIETEKKIGGMGERWKTHPGSDDYFDLTETENTLTVEFIFLIKRKQLTASAVNEFWKAFMINNFTGKGFYLDRPECIQHFRNWLKIQNFGTDSKNTQQNAAATGGTSAARVEALKKWGRSEAAESG